jgi:hypothetical protein
MTWRSEEEPMVKKVEREETKDEALEALIEASRQYENYLRLVEASGAEHLVADSESARSGQRFDWSRPMGLVITGHR